MGAGGHEVMEKEERPWSRGTDTQAPKTQVLGCSEWSAVCSGARGASKPCVASGHTVALIGMVLSSV